MELTPLNSQERSTLRQQEQIIDRGMDTVLEVGKALMVIRNQRLYKESHKSFSGYVNERWGMGNAYAHRLIEANETLKKVSPIGDTLPEAATINRESQLRELKDVPEEKLAEVIEVAAVKASDAEKPITAKILRESVQETMPEPEAPDPISQAKLTRKLVASYLGKLILGVDDYQRVQSNKRRHKRAHELIAELNGLLEGWK